MAGVVPAMLVASVRVLVPPIVQSFDGVVSPKIKNPNVGAVSSVTVLLAVRSSVLKFAVLSMPSATRPPDQLVVSLHRAPLFGLVHVKVVCASAPLHQAPSTIARMPRMN